jgi:hypothetical protein
LLCCNRTPLKPLPSYHNMQTTRIHVRKHNL